MRIGIDISLIAPPRTGIGNYTYYLVKNLLEINKKNHYILFSNRVIPCDIFDKDLKNNEFKIIKLIPKIRPFLWYLVYLPFYIKRHKIDIFLSTNFFTPVINWKTKVLTAIHDLTAQKYPQTHKWQARLMHKLFLQSSLKKSNLIISDSESTKMDIIDLFNIPSEKIRVIYPAISEIFKKIEDLNLLKSVKAKYSLPDRYILFVGTLEPRKNLALLLKAFAELKKTQSIGHKLVIVGRKGWLYSDIFDIIRKEQLLEEIILTGYVEEIDLPAIYSMAEVLVYPSIYEGFGLPPLEAMACGCPVIASNTSSLPEVVGDAGILINPYDVEALKQAILSVIRDDALRNLLRDRGLERAKMFSWEKTAKEVLKCFYEII